MAVTGCHREEDDPQIRISPVRKGIIALKNLKTRQKRSRDPDMRWPWQRNGSTDSAERLRRRTGKRGHNLPFTFIATVDDSCMRSRSGPRGDRQHTGT